MFILIKFAKIMNYLDMRQNKLDPVSFCARMELKIESYISFFSWKFLYIVERGIYLLHEIEKYLDVTAEERGVAWRVRDDISGLIIIADAILSYYLVEAHQ